MKSRTLRAQNIFTKSDAYLNQSESSVESEIGYLKKDAKNVKFKEMYRNLNIALQEITNEASIIGQSKDLNLDCFPDELKVKIREEMECNDSMYCGDQERDSEDEDNSPRLGKKCKSSLNEDCHIMSEPNHSSLDSSECNFRSKYSDNFEEDSDSYQNSDNFKHVPKYCPQESMKRPNQHLSGYKNSSVNIKSNSSKFYKCYEPLCSYRTFHLSNFQKHISSHYNQKLGRETSLVSVPQKILISNRGNRKYNNFQSIDDSGENSHSDKIIKCSLCNFVSFSAEGMKRHHIRYHNNDMFEESSEELDYENEHISDVSLNGEDQLLRCSFCSFNSQSPSHLRKHEQGHFQVVDDQHIGTSKKFKCFECDFETHHRITLARHEREHANFVNKANIKNNGYHFTARKHCNTSTKDTALKQRKGFTAKLIEDEYESDTLDNSTDLIQENIFCCCHCPFISVNKNEVATHQKRLHKDFESEVDVKALSLESSVCSTFSKSTKYTKKSMLTHLNQNDKPLNDQNGQNILLSLKNNCIVENKSSRRVKVIQSVGNEQRGLKGIKYNGQQFVKDVNLNGQLNGEESNSSDGLNSVDSYFDEREPISVGVNVEKTKKVFKNLYISDEEDTQYKNIGDVYRCEICSFTSTHKSHIRRHLLTHQKEKKIKCSKCSYATNFLRNLRQHELTTHQEIKKYSCSICNYKTNYLLRMRIHYQNIHPHKHFLNSSVC